MREEKEKCKDNRRDEQEKTKNKNNLEVAKQLVTLRVQPLP